MSSAHATTASAVPAATPKLVPPSTWLTAGLIFIALTALGLLVDTTEHVGFSWLIALCFWLSITIGALLFVMIHHVFDAGWSTVSRRTLEHWLAAFVPLAILFLPLIILGTFVQPGIIWRWLDVHAPAIANDVLWTKKSGFLNPTAFLIGSTIFFAVFISLSARLRRNSFAQDEDGAPAHTRSSRFVSGAGIPLAGLSLTFGAFYWFMSLEYHWFSTMYGVWFFASSMRAMFAFMALLSIYLTSRGVLAGIFRSSHLLNFGNLSLTFTIFWAYVTFSQYFLIWNANVPEETFWYVLREVDPSTGLPNSWKAIGMVIVFGHFLIPFLYLLQHPLKKKHGTMIFICVWILVTQLIDFTFNILPGQKLPNGDPVPFGTGAVWLLTALLGIGSVCMWAFARSMTKARAIPIRDPRIIESLHLHE
jgi:hypothetical protein